MIRFATHKRHLSLYRIQLRDVLRTSVCPFQSIFPIPNGNVKIARTAKRKKFWKDAFIKYRNNEPLNVFGRNLRCKFLNDSFCYAQTSPLRRNGRYGRICFANIDVDALLLLSHSEHAYATTLNGARCVGLPKSPNDFLGKRQNKIATIVFLRKT